MKLFIMKIFAILFLASCISSKLGASKSISVENKVFTFESNIRTISFAFDTANCLITAAYKCNSIKKQYEKIDISCTYMQLNDSMIVIKNKLYRTDSEFADLTPPNDELEKCLQSKSVSSKNKNKVNAWSGDDGFIPAIGIDTIKMFSKKDKLFLFLSKHRDGAVYNFLLQERH